jgi:hypothetical protein
VNQTGYDDRRANYQPQVEDRGAINCRTGLMAERHEKFYAAQAATAVGDVVRGIDTLGNARFVRTVIENAQLHRLERLVREFGLADADLRDAGRGHRYPGVRGAHGR